MRRRAGAVLGVLGVLLAPALGGAPAGAGGGTLAPVKDRYEPGETATMVGYTGIDVPDDTFYAYLRPFGEDTLPALDDGGIYLGELVVAETPHRGYLRQRVSITFDIPAALRPGPYELTYCVDPCTATFLGDLVPSPVSIGVDPARPVLRMWAADEPEIANLAAGAALAGPGMSTTAGALRAPPTTLAAVPAPAAPLPPPPPAPVAGAGTGAGDMDLAVPVVLVLAAAAATALVLGRLQRARHELRRGALARR